VEYALDDVRYLVPVYDALVAELASRGRTAWAEEEFAAFTDEAHYRESDERELYLKVRGADRMNGAGLAALRELVAWREETARAENVPLSRIGRDEVLIELARRPRTSTRELQEVRGMQPQQIARYGKGLIEAAQRGTTAPKPVVRRGTLLPPGLEPTIDFLALCLRSLCAEASISPGVVATRGDLAALVADGDEADVPVMRGWRREAIGNTLLETLKGHATVRIMPKTRRVHLEWAEGSKQ
jgi:ribonuclease D